MNRFKSLYWPLLIAVIYFSSPKLFPAHATDADTNAAVVESDTQSPEKMWQVLSNSFLQIDRPREWRTNPPSKDAAREWFAKRTAKAVELADQSKNFYTRFPNCPQAALAHESEYNLLDLAVGDGSTNLIDRLTVLDQQKLANVSTNAEEKFELMAHIVERNADSHLLEGNPVVMAWLEKGSRDLLRMFPDNPQSWQFLVTVADQAQDPAKARRLAEEIIASKADEGLKIRAEQTLKQLDQLNKPVSARFVTVDGRVVDIKKMKGTVIALHFWENGCGFCVAELPTMKSIYEKYHSKGFEIVGIDLEWIQDPLDEYLKNNPLPWPVYFGGTNWDNTYGKKFDVHGMPTVWLIDKKGKLRDLNARIDLEAKVEKLLAE